VALEKAVHSDGVEEAESGHVEPQYGEVWCERPVDRFAQLVAVGQVEFARAADPVCDWPATLLEPNSGHYSSQRPISTAA
jgi:hypothetical protein